MDPFGAAASGIAVVSLAIQLVDSVRQLQRFLRSVSEAPKELKRLINLLEQLELILDNIGSFIENQRIQQRFKIGIATDPPPQSRYVTPGVEVRQNLGH